MYCSTHVKKISKPLTTAQPYLGFDIPVFQDSLGVSKRLNGVTEWPAA